MPMIIKKSNGQRSFQHVPLTAAKTSSPMEDIIAALKGLTFKVEIKISDVIYDSPTQEHEAKQVEVSPSPEMIQQKQPDRQSSSTLEIRQPPQSVVPTKSMVTSQTMVPPQVQQLPPKLVHSESVRPSQTSPPPARVAPSQPSPPPTLAPPSQPSPPPTLKPPKQPLPPALAPEPSSNIPDQVTTPSQAVTTPPIPSAVAQTSQRPKLVRGSLVVGSVLKTICIAADDTMQPPEAFIYYDQTNFTEVEKKLSSLAGEIESLPKVTSIQVDDVVFAKSSEDGSWYRAIVEEVNGNDVSVYYFDWGLREKLISDNIKRLLKPELGFAQHPACAMKIKFQNSDSPLVNDAVNCEKIVKMRVESFDDASQSYTVTLL